MQPDLPDCSGCREVETEELKPRSASLVAAGSETETAAVASERHVQGPAFLLHPKGHDQAGVISSTLQSIVPYDCYDADDVVPVNTGTIHSTPHTSL